MQTPSHPHADYQRTRHIGLFLALSLLIHGLLIFTLKFQQREDLTPAAAAARGPISVQLLPAPSSPPQASVAQPATPAQPLQKLPKARKPALAKRKATPPPIARLERPSPEPSSVEPETARPAPPAMDMMDMINAARERRRRAEQEAALDNAQAAEAARAAGANSIALANINRDLQRYSRKSQGVGGRIRVLHIGVRTGEFQFNGYNPASGESWRQTFEVDAGENGDVQLAIVRRLIKLIRSYYSGDFEWESHRLNRVLTLSARPADNEELEAFLMRELFEA